MSDLDELKEKWAEHDRKIETSIRLNLQLLRVAKIDRARSALQRLAIILTLEAAINFVAVGALGSFIYAHVGQARFAIPAIVLDIFAIAILSALIGQIAAALTVDYDKPVAVIQRQLEALRVIRIRYVQGIFLTATLAWMPLLIVVLRGFFGVDAYRLFGPAWLWANVLLGVAVIPVGVWLSRRLASRVDHSPVVQRLMRDLSGYNLNAAQGFLSTLAEFEG